MGASADRIARRPGVLPRRTASSIIFCVPAGSCFQIPAAAQRPHSALTRSGTLVEPCWPQHGQRQFNIVVSFEAISSTANPITRLITFPLIAAMRLATDRDGDDGHRLADMPETGRCVPWPEDRWTP